MAELHLGGGFVVVTDLLSRREVRRLRRRLGKENPRLLDHDGAAVVTVTRGCGGLRKKLRRVLQLSPAVRLWPCEALLAHGGTFTPNN